MTPEEYRNAVMDVIYLASCAINGVVPDSSRTSSMDPENLFQAAERHLLTGITAIALESAGIKYQTFTQAKGKAVRKVAALDLDRSLILTKLEEAGIWYMPLKGSILKEMYPRIGMRQMSDNDILFDASRAKDVKNIMENLGFTTVHYGTGTHDVYHKLPVSSFEMHRALFGPGNRKEFYEYYRNVKQRLLPAESAKYGFRFTDEDFYVYMIAHEYKHYSGGGTGLRSLLDTYVYCQKKKDTLDWVSISKELETLGISDFECKNRELAVHLFQGEALSEEDQAMLDYIVSSGTYGILRHRVQNQMKQNNWGKFQYMWSRFLVPVSQKNRDYDAFALAYPLFYKYKVLLPLLPFYRTFRAMKSGRFHAEAKAIRKLHDKH